MGVRVWVGGWVGEVVHSALFDFAERGFSVWVNFARPDFLLINFMQKNRNKDFRKKVDKIHQMRGKRD